MAAMPLSQEWLIMYFNNNPRYLLIYEIDKMPTKDQAFMLNLIETGTIAETKHRKTRTVTNVKT
jgi:hypothetical protein